VKIIDFGVSKYKFDEDKAMSMTTTGALVGTPYYLSPEQARGERDIDARSDLYTVGVIMYQAVAGRVPVRADTFNELLFKIALEPAPKLSEEVPRVDPAFSALIEKAMTRERDKRFQSASEMRLALELWLGITGRGVASPVSGRTAVPWAGNATVESPPFPTSSNFGRTDASTSPFGAKSKRRTLVLAAVGAGIVVVIGLAVAFTQQGAREPAASGVAPRPVLSEATATEAQVPSVAAVPDPVVAPVPAPLAEVKPPELAPPPEPAVAPARRPAPAQPRAKPAVQAPVQADQPAPAPTPTSRRRRDFGY
jgi:eukaryotic-like serine/threonine-protein kinase